MQKAWVQSPMEELESHVPSAMAKKKKKKEMKGICLPFHGSTDHNRQFTNFSEKHIFVLINFQLKFRVIFN